MDVDNAPDDLLHGSTAPPDPRTDAEDERTPEGRLLFHRVKGKLFGTAPIADPVRIGRFVVIKRIGQGGMGLIYSAYDDQLDRKVAVKLLRPERAGAGGDGHTRLMREAQALARLSHPNVIHVYEVGAYEDQVYVAMEYVDGATLETWQAKRDWREIVELYLEAGRGLAAAHDAGIVHRDFKAENVLVRGEDRAVRVVDFGLARTEFEPGDAEVDALRELGEHAVDIPLTHTGVIMGTPAYMAPEQHAGRATDPRTDQFSFCVTLWEALYGFRPFAGANLQELRHNVLEGSVEPAPPFTDVPASIHRALLRGLSVDPDARYPTMAALLDDLAEPTSAGRWAWYAAATGVLAVSAALGLWWSAATDREIRQEGLNLRAAFERARVVEAEEELRRLRSQTVAEKWNEVVLTYAQQHARDAPTEALAALKHLATDEDGWLDAARTVAADAARRGPIVREFDPATVGAGSIAEVRFAPDGLEVAALTETGRILRWNVRSGAHAVVTAPVENSDSRRRTSGDATPVRFGHIAFDRFGRLIASAPGGRLVRWTNPDAAEVGLVGELEITALAAGSEGTLAVGDATGAVHVLEEDAFASRHVLRNHEGAIRSLDFAPNGTELASASDDGTVRLWDLAEGVHRTFRVGLTATHCRLLDQGRILATRRGDGTIRTWATDDGRRLNSRGSARHAFDGSAGGGAIVLDDPDLGLAVRYPDDTAARPLHFRGKVIYAIAVDPTGGWAVAATDHGLAAWRIGENEAGARPGGDIPLVARRDGSVSTMAFAPDGALVWGTRWGVLRRWDPDGTSTELLDIEGAIMHLAIDDDGGSAVIDDEEGRVLVVPLRGGPVTALPPVDYATAGALQWSPDGSLVARLACTGPVRCSVDLFRLDGTPPSRLAASELTREIRFSPDARSLIIDAKDGVTVWRDGQDPTPIGWPADARADRRLALAFTPQGALRIATTDAASDANLVRDARLDVWQLGDRPHRVHALFSEPSLATILPSEDRRSLLLRTTEGRNLLWRLEEDRFHMLPDDVGEVSRMMVSPDGTAMLVVGTGDQESKIIDVESGHARSLPPVFGLVAWSPDGALAVASRGAHKWTDPTPADPERFEEWLDETTSVEIPSRALHQ